MIISIKISKMAQISLECYFFPLINVKMPTIIGIFTFMSRKNFMLSRVEHENLGAFITSGPGLGENVLRWFTFVLLLRLYAERVTTRHSIKKFRYAVACWKHLSYFDQMISVRISTYASAHMMGVFFLHLFSFVFIFLFLKKN